MRTYTAKTASTCARCARPINPGETAVPVSHPRLGAVHQRCAPEPLPPACRSCGQRAGRMTVVWTAADVRGVMTPRDAVCHQCAPPVTVPAPPPRPEPQRKERWR